MRLEISIEEALLHHAREIADILEKRHGDDTEYAEEMVFVYEYEISPEDDLSKAEPAPDKLDDEIRRVSVSLVMLINEITYIHKFEKTPPFFARIFKEMNNEVNNQNIGAYQNEFGEFGPIGPVAYGVPNLVLGGYDLDEILDKIDKTGMDSLTYGEKRFLNKQK